MLAFSFPFCKDFGSKQLPYFWQLGPGGIKTGGWKKGRKGRR